MKPEALARRAGSAAGADGGGIPSPAPDARKESDGDGKKVATGSNVAAWDEDEEALGALIYKTSRAAKARDESIIGKKSRAPKEEEAPARSKREDKRKESGETSVTPRASSFSATHDVDEEALGALIYKNSRTAKARAQANNGNKRRREKPLSSDEGKPPRKKRRRKAKEEGESSRKKVAVSGSSTRPRRGAAIKAAAKLSRSGSDCEQRETSVTRARPRRHVVAIGAATKISGHMSQEDGGSDDDESLGYDSDSSGVTSKRPYRSGHRRNGNKGTPLKQEERNDQDWNEKYEQLKAYRADHGHCNVPQRYGNDPQLGRWVKRQRQEKRKGKLPCKRAELLQKIGFQWTTVNVGVFKSNDKQWMKNFEKLQAYKAENGDCNVPKRYALLGKWVQWQRYLYKDGKLADERKERLEEIGFNWGLYDTHGHWNIHPSYRVDGFLLASWANIQIQACKRGQLSKARQQKLKAIGFRLAGNGVSGRKGLKKRKADKMAEESADNSDAGSSCGKEDDDSSCSLKTPPEEIEPPGVGDAVLAYYLYSCGKKGEWIDATITNVNTHSENGAEWATYDVEYNDGYTDDHLPDSKIRRCPPPEDNGKEEDNDGEEEAAEEKRATRSRTNDVELQRVDASTNRREERAAARKKRTARSAPADGDSSRANEEGSRPVLHDDARTRKQIKEDALWSEKFEQLLAYKTKHGHCNMAASCDGDNHLGEWVEEQREQYELWKEGEHSELTDERVAMLESVDFDFAPGRSRNKKRQKVVDKTQTAGPKEPRKARTIASAPRERPGRSAAKKAAAKLFRKESNEISNANYDIDSSDLPRKRRSNSNQRRSSNKGNKPKGRRRKDYDEKWDNRFGQLQAFVKEHGHCNVMKRDDNDPQLGRWVSKQRARLKEGKLAAERKELLDEIGFSWSILREWDEMFELLRTYKKKHGHCNVPHKYPENPQLANWTRKQQWRRKEGKLADDRIKLLDSIEFDWGDERNRGERWDDHFDLLRAYKKKHGHCNVRRHDRVKGIALGHWVGYQRMALKEGYLSLSSERKKRLDELGFQWRIR